MSGRRVRSETCANAQTAKAGCGIRQENRLKLKTRLKFMPIRKPTRKKPTRKKQKEIWNVFADYGKAGAINSKAFSLLAAIKQLKFEFGFGATEVTITKTKSS